MALANRDGRTQRTENTRHKILTATRNIILASDCEPTSKQIAEHAEITTRTLFRHFNDMDALYKDFIQDAERRAFEVMEEPFPDDQSEDWLTLIDIIIDRRIRVYESLLPLFVSTIWRRYQVHQGTKRRRQRLRQVLPEVLKNNKALFEALDATLGMEFWVSLRRDQKLTQSKAKLVLEFAVKKLTT